MSEAPQRTVLATIQRRGAIVILAAVVSWPLVAQQPSARPLGSVHGVVSDSVRGGVLAGSFVELLPTARQAIANSAGEFLFDTVPPGEAYRLRVMHARIDTLGVALTTPPFALLPSESKHVDFAVPSASRLVTLLCSDALRGRGPSAIIGFVRDPDTGAVPDSTTVSLVYDESPLDIVKLPVTRVAHTDAAGHYVICGLPSGINGRMQLSRRGVSSSDIPVATEANSPLTLRAFGLGLSSRRVAGSNDKVGKSVQVLGGNATVRGRVVSQTTGLPIIGARLQMDGTVAVAITRTDGSFTLDSVPTGTQLVSARKIGYGVTDATVEVARSGTLPVTVIMPDYVQALAPVVTVAQRSKDLDAVGFTRRKAMGIGVFREGDEVDKGPTDVGESLRMIPGLHIGYDANSQTSQKTVIMSSRNANECVNIIIDGVVWRDSSSAIEEYVRPEEIEALEMYSSATVPERVHCRRAEQMRGAGYMDKAADPPVTQTGTECACDEGDDEKLWRSHDAARSRAGGKGELNQLL